MADWWMDDDQISSSYRCAADRVNQIKILGQLCSATKKEVLQKLLEIGSISEEKYDEYLSELCDRRKTTPRTIEVWMGLYKSGYSDAAIGKLTGNTKSTIRSWRHRLNLKSNNPALGVDGIWRDQTYIGSEKGVER